MTLNVRRARQYLRRFDFGTLFTDELGWERHSAALEVPVDGSKFKLTAIAEKRGLVVFTCAAMFDGRIPDYATRLKIEMAAAKAVYEHVIIYTDAAKTTQVWQWVKREAGKPTARRETAFNKNQTGDLLIQKLDDIAFSLEEEELAPVDATGHVHAAFDVERMTRRFYERFKTEHAAFLRFIKGVPDEELRRWYASVMINRLMFVYFIQKKGLLNEDVNYLRNKLAESKRHGKNVFYPEFLRALFFRGFAEKENARSASTNRLLGKVPYLNGSLFMRHQIEEAHGKRIQIPDSAFEKLFEFFEGYRWHLDECPLREDDEINPDILGYIFEKHINQKQMGAYYTKQDITEYISKNTIIPCVFGRAQKKCKMAFEGEHSCWRQLQANPDRYIYNALKHGISIDACRNPPGPLETVLPLPDEIAIGLNDISKRGEWNKPAPKEYGLPAEIWREVVTRRRRHEEVHSKLAGGGIQSINDFITYNLDVRQFAQDVIQNCESPELLRAFWQAIERATVLDPTCGSGAFLFGALNILEPLYDACLERMRAFLEELTHSGEKDRPEKLGDFRNVLERAAKHPNNRYFILKSIIVNNLFGVDIMEEAAEICKLRLFLKLVAQLDSGHPIEPLPDIDFNIQAGNTLVGFATYDEVKRAVTSKFDSDNAMGRIEEEAQDIDRLFGLFRHQQRELVGEVTAADKQELRKRLTALEAELNDHLAGEYGVSGNKLDYERWLTSHKPFHWFIEYYRIVKGGGFDVVMGNPPYVEYNKVRKDYTVLNYKTEDYGNLYAFTWERSSHLCSSVGRIGMIIPVASVCTEGYASLQRVLRGDGTTIVSNFNDRPGKLFDGLEHIRLSIILHEKGRLSRKTFSTCYNKWQAVERPNLFQRLSFVETTSQNLGGAMAKIGSHTESAILEKLSRENKLIGEYIRESGKASIYYTRKLSHFVQVLDFVPTILDERNRKREPSELKELCFERPLERDIFLAVLNSSLFYWLLTVYSDCRNLNKREIELVRFDTNRANDKTIQHLCRLSRELMENIDRTSRMLTMTYKDLGTLKIQCTYPRYSKAIIDEIDSVLAKHYGFTSEELDFIINYDIKYRMGRDGPEEN